MVRAGRGSTLYYGVKPDANIIFQSFVHAIAEEILLYVFVIGWFQISFHAYFISYLYDSPRLSSRAPTHLF